MRTALTLIVVAAALLAAACSSTSGPGGGPSAPIFGYPPAAWDVRPEGRQWTTITHNAFDTLAPDLVSVVPSDIDAFCPGYRAATPANRRAFYVAVLGELARYESNFEPSVRFTESFKDANGRPVISRGLLQLSQESANGYGCGITDPEQLQDPAINLQCSVRVLSGLVKRDQVIAGYTSGSWRGASRYWHPFRERDKLVDLQAALNAKPYCARPRSS